MIDGTAEARALQPLWLLATGSCVGALSASFASVAPPTWLPMVLLFTGLAATSMALSWKGNTRYELWFLAGLALVSGRGLGQTVHTLELSRMVSDGETVVRARVVTVEGWSDARWGRRTKARTVTAHRGDEEVRLPTTVRLEIRGTVDPGALPAPGDEIDVMARVRGSKRNTLLVVSSPRLVQGTGNRRFLPAFRDHLAQSLLDSAGTDVRRIRAAEMAAALALGRRDLMPMDRRDRWRRSGLAHLLAVSGLHVGLVGGFVWLVLALSGVSPTRTRLTVLFALPAYAILAGAAPSAMRAALMAAIYLGARLMGRAVLPMAAVLLAVTLLLIANPSLIGQVGFQLTVVITAALVRWVPPLSSFLFGPPWLTGAVAVPIVAQAAAAPIVTWHFRTVIPGAILANLLARPLLAPTILGSVAAAAIAPLWRWPAALGLDLVGFLLTLLRAVSSPARAIELVTPPAPLAAAALFVIVGWIALQTRPMARYGVIGWLSILLALGIAWRVPAQPTPPAVTLLPVSDGAAIVVTDGTDTLLFDTGNYRRETAQLLAERRIRRMRAVIASHTDEDHLGGLDQVLRSFDVDQLLMPAWMFDQQLIVPILRTARRRQVSVRPVAAGSAVGCGSLQLEFLWPPATNPPRMENERSLVARSRTGGGSVLLTADIGRATEHRLVTHGPLRSSVLVVAHHGGRGSTSPAFLDAVAPSVALIPAAPGNNHGHPHAEVVQRLAVRGIPSRYPLRDGWCGAVWGGISWTPFP